MFVPRITFHHTTQAIVVTAFGAALLAGPASARPVDGPFLHNDRAATVQPAVAPATALHDSIAQPAVAQPVAPHDSIAPSTTTGTVTAYHDSIATTGPAAGHSDRIAPPTLADSAYRDGSAGPVYRAGVSSNVKGFSNPRIFAAANATHTGPAGSGDAPWAAIGAGLLVAALGTVGIVALGRRPRTPARRAPQGTPSFGA